MMIHMIYMAAGNSRRFGEKENKLLFKIENKPMYQHGFHKLMNLCEKEENCDLIVVTQYKEIFDDIQIFCEKNPDKLRVIFNEDSKLGISYTIKAAIQAIYGKDCLLKEEQRADYLLFMVADQPYITENTIRKLMCLATGNTETASLICQGSPGNPTLISVSFLSELMALEGDKGGRSVIKNHNCQYVEAESGMELIDIDYKRSR